jgi:hypothetical protein
VELHDPPKDEYWIGYFGEPPKVLTDGRAPAAIASPDDYTLDLRRLVERLEHSNVKSVRYAIHPDLRLEPGELPVSWQKVDLDVMTDTAQGT